MRIHKHYLFEKALGEGAFGKVKMASLHGNPDKKFAIKSIPRDLFDLRGEAKEEEEKSYSDSSEDFERRVVERKMQNLLQDEIQIVLEMDHPNIVKFHQCVYDN